MDSISIVTPSFNQEKFIERTINSVLSQGIIDLEYLIIDGGSSDETLTILRKYEDQLRWVSEPDNGQAYAVNKGIIATRGKIIGWINSDDVYYPEALIKVLQYFSENPLVDVVYGDAFHIDINDNEIESYYTEDWDFENFKNICFLCQPAVFFRRRMIEKFGLLDEFLQFCMDYEFWLRLGKRGAVFAYLPVSLAGSRMYAENKTLSKRVPVHAEINGMLKKKFGKVPTRWVFNFAHVKADEWTARGRVRLLLLIWYSFLAAFRWNRGLSKEFLQIIGSWIFVERPK